LDEAGIEASACARKFSPYVMSSQTF